MDCSSDAHLAGCWTFEKPARLLAGRYEMGTSSRSPSDVRGGDGRQVFALGAALGRALYAPDENFVLQSPEGRSDSSLVGMISGKKAVGGHSLKIGIQTASGPCLGRTK